MSDSEKQQIVLTILAQQSGMTKEDLLKRYPDAEIVVEKP